MELLDPKALVESQEKEVQLESQEARVKRVTLAMLEIMVALEEMVLVVPPVLVVPQVQLEVPVTGVNPDLLVPLDSLAHVVLLVNVVKLVPLVLPDLLDPLVLLVMLELREREV